MSEFKHALSTTFGEERAGRAWRNPIRRRHLIAQFGLVGITGFLAACFAIGVFVALPAWLPVWLRVVAGGLVGAASGAWTYFRGYEFVGEPLTKWLMRRRREILGRELRIVEVNYPHAPTPTLAASLRYRIFRLPWRERLIVWAGEWSWFGAYFERGARSDDAPQLHLERGPHGIWRLFEAAESYGEDA